ncbi:MAG: hypothetical protein OXP37_07570 [Chloroflexota bacterium]|nr:hypothetical protein [Chloroflexota bacterium]MDE2936678.1 hypothetical protein [Chloroflexota bacterium]
MIEFVATRDRRVVNIGGREISADCLGTANCRGASHVHQLDIHV